MIDTAVQIILVAIPAILAITLHETSHGYAALALGDDTAKTMGRLSLNPVRHIDPVGTILLPGALILGQLLTVGRIVFLFGWAKPVPVSAWRFSDPRRMMALVAAAGPLTNFVLAWVGALALHGMPYLPAGVAFVLQDMLETFILANLILGLFNLLPIPPLDGGRIVVGILPLPLAALWARLERAGIVIVLLVVFIGPRLLAEFGVAFDPVGAALRTVVPWSLNVVFHAAGLTG